MPVTFATSTSAAARPAPEKFGWRIKEWGDAVGLKRSTVYKIIDANEVETVKLRRARVITTPPRDYLEAQRGK